MGKHIVSIGDLVLDIILPVRFPIIGGHHQRPEDRSTEPGGSANFMIAARNMGVEVTAAGTVGEDVYGARILAPLREHKIDITHVIVTPGSTSTIVVTLTDRVSGEHVFLGHYGEGPDVPYPDGLDAKIAAADAVFLSGYTLVEKRIRDMTLRAVEYAHKLGKPIFMDVGPLFKMADQDLVDEVIKKTYVLFLTSDEATLVTDDINYEEAYSDLLLKGPKFAVVKRGPRGCVIVTNDWWYEAPAFPVDRVVDTVGAGDNFDAAFIAGRIHGLEMRDCAVLANAMGAASTQKVGAGTNAPTYAEVKAILEQHGQKINYPDPT